VISAIAAASSQIDASGSITNSFRMSSANAARIPATTSGTRSRAQVYATGLGDALIRLAP